MAPLKPAKRSATAAGTSRRRFLARREIQTPIQAREVKRGICSWAVRKETARNMPERAALAAARGPREARNWNRKTRGIQTAPFIIWGQAVLPRKPERLKTRPPARLAVRERPRLRQKR